MNKNSLTKAASFTPNTLQFPNAWIGHLPFAAWVMQAVSPKIFVELGTHSGNSYFSFCQSVVEAGLSTACYAVDTWQGDEHTGLYGNDIFAKVNAYHEERYAGFSRLLRMPFDTAVSYFTDESIGLLHIDGLHTYEAVKHDFETWLPKLVPGAVVIFHDTNVRERNFGVWKYWEELQARYPNNLEFVHSHGLGVLQLNNVPDIKRLEWLQLNSPEKQQFISYFAALGSRQMERYELNELQTQIASLNQSMAVRDGQIGSLNQSVHKRDEQIAKLNQSLVERGGQIININRVVAERDRVVTNLNQAIVEREGQITSLNQGIVEREGQIASLNQGIVERDGQIVSLNQAIVERDNTIKSLIGSRSMKITAPFRYIGLWLRRGRTFKQCVLPTIKDPKVWPKRLGQLYRAWRKGGLSQVKHSMRAQLIAPERNDYWAQHTAEFDKKILPQLQQEVKTWTHRPLISILIPTFNTNAQYLTETILSVQNQIYQNWELCIVDDASTLPHVKAMLEGFSKKDSRIKIHISEKNKGVSATTNKALEMAAGEFIVLLDHDDFLERHAIMRVAECVIKDDPDFLYSDEVQISEDGANVNQIVLRPAFSLELLRGHPYIVHLVGFKTKVLRDIGGLDESLRISQDYDLILRVVEVSRVIVHIPEVLYRWRIHKSSAGHQMINQVMATSKNILQRHLDRCNLRGTIKDGPGFNLFRTDYEVKENNKVAIVIPTKDQCQLLKACVNSIKKTTPSFIYDIFIIDHESEHQETLDYLDEISNEVTVLKYKGDFNFSKINNWAVSIINKSYSHILLCNNDIEAIEDNWLLRMLELSSQRPEVGIVGSMLLYSDAQTIQHAGVCVGMNGKAEHFGKFHKLSRTHLDAGYMGFYILNHEVSAVTAACLLIKRNVFDEISGFDELMKVGFGDVDLCLRVLERGYLILFCPDSRLIHHESKTRGISVVDNHPEDTAYYLEKWKNCISSGDVFYNKGFSLNSTTWEFETNSPITAKLIRRVCTVTKKNMELRYSYSYSH